MKAFAQGQAKSDGMDGAGKREVQALVTRGSSFPTRMPIWKWDTAQDHPCASPDSQVGENPHMATSP